MTLVTTLALSLCKLALLIELNNTEAVVVVSTVTSQQEGSWFESQLGPFCVEFVLPVYAWVLSGYSGFLPPSKNMHVRLTGDSELSRGVSVDGCLSLCGPVMDW